MDTDRYLHAKDCEALAGIPASAWRYWAHKGAGPADFKLGRRRVYRESAIRVLIAEPEAQTGSGVQ